MRKCAPAWAATWGRWVMQSTWWASPSARSRSPTARAVWPPTPASTSSNTSVRDSPPPATVISASMTRDSSPPEADSRSGAAGTPGLGASISSTRSAPVAAISVRGSSSTWNSAPSMARFWSSARTCSARRGPASRRAAVSSSARREHSALRGVQLHLRLLQLHLGPLQGVAALAAPLGVREHRGHVATVLALQAVVQLEPALHLLELARVALEPLEVAPQLAAEVVGLDPQRGDARRQRIQLGVHPGNGAHDALGLREQSRHAGLAALRSHGLGAATRGGRERVEPAEPLAPGGQLLAVGLARVHRLDLVDLEAEQVEVPVTGARALVELRQAAFQLPDAPVRIADTCSQLAVALAPEGVQQIELCRRQGEPAVLVLAEERHEPASQRLEVGRRGGAPLHEGARAAVLPHSSREDDLVHLVPYALAQIAQVGAVQEIRRSREHPLHVGLARPGTDDARSWLAAEQEIQRMGQDRLPRPRLAGDHREPRPGAQLGSLDQEKILDPQLEEHGVRSTNGPRRSDAAPWEERRPDR